MQDTEKLVEVIGPCTEDIRDCEVMRAAIALENAGPENEQAYDIRSQLAEVACKDCIIKYLGDVE